MLMIIRARVDAKTLEKVAQDLDGYIKVVVDVDQGILSAGGLRHYEGEQLLLQSGSKQEHLWGGGLDLQTDGIDFDSMVNIRPHQGNTSREVLSAEIRTLMEEIIRRLLG